MDPRHTPLWRMANCIRKAEGHAQEAVFYLAFHRMGGMSDFSYRMYKQIAHEYYLEALDWAFRAAVSS